MGKRADVPTFGKEALIAARKYEEYRDVLRVLLEDDREYSAAEVSRLVKSFWKRKV